MSSTSLEIILKVVFTTYVKGGDFLSTIFLTNFIFENGCKLS